ncbi:hypothetical protein HID58_037906 [Brassica napus]|uniref:Uncharacterized protein n=1 Tax=Brassica napus TaxID=3708 RepID=A0ABQ8BMP0_BRANA|nr:hypothetical protein HID58_037906 [Brassica napus]
MSEHVIIKNRKPKKSKRHTPLLSRLSRAREYTIADVRRCIRSQPYEVTDKECRNIFRHARLRGLANHPLRTLPSYTDEMKSCLGYGNRDHVEGMNLLDVHKWRSNTYVVDKLWKQVKRLLHEVPMWLIKNSFYGTNMILIMPPRACELNKLENRCSKCFYYKEMAKFMELVHRC